MLFSLSFLFVTQANQSDLIHTLQTGTSQQRVGALEQILNIPPAQRTEQLWLALADRLQSESEREHQELDAALAGQNVPDDGIAAEDDAHYLGDLVTALGQWHDPRALPALISAAGRAGTEIGQFGDQAVAPLAKAARQGHYSDQSMVLYELRLLLEGRPDYVSPNGSVLHIKVDPVPLSAQSKQQIRDLARDLLKPKALKMPEATLQQVSNLALATGDPDLRQQVQTLVDLPSELSNTTGITDANKLLQVQNSIRAALAEHKK